MIQETALQQLVKYLDPIHSAILDKALRLMEVEKQQIIDSYFQGFREGRGIDNIDVSGTIFIEDTNAEHYYESTYQPNENHSPKGI